MSSRGSEGSLQIRVTTTDGWFVFGHLANLSNSVSPWGYETIQRWTAKAVDPNRSFNPEGEVVAGRKLNPEPETEESRILIDLLARMKDTYNVERWLLHVDCHETT